MEGTDRWQVSPPLRRCFCTSSGQAPAFDPFLNLNRIGLPAKGRPRCGSCSSCASACEARPDPRARAKVASRQRFDLPVRKTRPGVRVRRNAAWKDFRCQPAAGSPSTRGCDMLRRYASIRGSVAVHPSTRADHLGRSATLCDGSGFTPIRVGAIAVWPAIFAR